MKEITYRDAVMEALGEELAHDEKVFLIGEDIGFFGGTNKTTAGLFDKFGAERVRDAPISESAIIGCAVGAAVAGLRPVAEISYIDFTAVCMDQIANQAAKIRYMSGGQAKVPLTIRTVGGSGRSSAAQHAQSLEAWFMHTPGLIVVMAATPYDVKGLLKSAVREDNPVIFIEHKMLYNTKGLIPEEEYLVPLGVAEIKREGKDLTVVATSRMVLRSLAVAEQLAAEGISVEVIDPKTLVPLDKETILNSVKKTGKLAIVHEAPERGGFGAELAAVVAGEALDYLTAPVQRICALNVPMPFAPVLEDHVAPNETRITAELRKLAKAAF